MVDEKVITAFRLTFPNLLERLAVLRRLRMAVLTRKHHWGDAALRDAQIVKDEIAWTMKMVSIPAALRLLDPKNDGDWTSDGLPLIDRIQELLNDQTVTRAEITAADPEFCREKAR